MDHNDYSTYGYTAHVKMNIRYLSSDPHDNSLKVCSKCQFVDKEAHDLSDVHTVVRDLLESQIALSGFDQLCD